MQYPHSVNSKSEGAPPLIPLDEVQSLFTGDSSLEFRRDTTSFDESELQLREVVFEFHAQCLTQHLLDSQEQFAKQKDNLREQLYSEMGNYASASRAPGYARLYTKGGFSGCIQRACLADRLLTAYGSSRCAEYDLPIPSRQKLRSFYQSVDKVLKLACRPFMDNPPKSSHFYPVRLFNFITRNNKHTLTMARNDYEQQLKLFEKFINHRLNALEGMRETYIKLRSHNFISDSTCSSLCEGLKIVSDHNRAILTLLRKRFKPDMLTSLYAHMQNQDVAARLEHNNKMNELLEDADDEIASAELPMDAALEAARNAYNSQRIILESLLSAPSDCNALMLAIDTITRLPADNEDLTVEYLESHDALRTELLARLSQHTHQNKLQAADFIKIDEKTRILLGLSKNVESSTSDSDLALSAKKHTRGKEKARSFSSKVSDFLRTLNTKTRSKLAERYSTETIEMTLAGLLKHFDKETARYIVRQNIEKLELLQPGNDEFKLLKDAHGLLAEIKPALPSSHLLPRNNPELYRIEGVNERLTSLQSIASCKQSFSAEPKEWAAILRGIEQVSRFPTSDSLINLEDKLLKMRSKIKGEQTLRCNALQKYTSLLVAHTLNDLRAIKGLNLEALNTRNPLYSLRLNLQWRLTFRLDKEGNLQNVKVVDYH